MQGQSRDRRVQHSDIVASAGSPKHLEDGKRPVAEDGDRLDLSGQDEEGEGVKTGIVDPRLLKTKALAWTHAVHRTTQSQ